MSMAAPLPDLIDLYLTSCRIEGKTRDTNRSYRETLKHFMRAVDAEGLPRDPPRSAPATASRAVSAAKTDPPGPPIFLKFP